MRALIDRLLESPWAYRLQGVLVGLGSAPTFLENVRRVARTLPPADRILDVGCGPESWLAHVGVRPVGLDVSLSYLRRLAESGGLAVAGSATALPVRCRSFDAVWSIGLLHHLPDEAAAAALREMVRTCRPGGWVVILDGVLPLVAWRRPLAHLIRRADRGQHMRPEVELRDLLPESIDWKCDRFTYTTTGLEAVFCLGKRVSVD